LPVKTILEIAATSGPINLVQSELVLKTKEKFHHSNQISQKRQWKSTQNKQITVANT